jgi:very-short-patch-repair endonuclease
MVKLKNELVKGNRSLAEQITIDLLRFKFKKLKVLTNDKTAIGKELDIFLPDFKIAIEIDGIFHQRIVYSEKSFEATKKNDLRKNILCKDAGILLFRIPLPEDSRTYYTFLKKEILENIAPAISNIINAPTIS